MLSIPDTTKSEPSRPLLGLTKPHIYRRGQWYFMYHSNKDFEEVTRAAKLHVVRLRARDQGRKSC